MNILIIEDEIIAARDLIGIINEIRPEYKILKVIDSVEDSIEFINKQNEIDLILSDIQLVDGKCFEIFKQVELKCPVIFCTAYDNFALDAFDANGIDYILKPFDKLKLEKSFSKFELLSKVDYSKYTKLVNSIEEKANSKDSLVVFSRDKIIPLKLNNIALFYLKNEGVIAITKSETKYYLNESLSDLEIMNEEVFFRANRQVLINRNSIQEAKVLSNRKIEINLNIKINFPILVSKEKAKSFLNWLSNK